MYCNTHYTVMGNTDFGHVEFLSTANDFGGKFEQSASTAEDEREEARPHDRQHSPEACPAWCYSPTCIVLTDREKDCS